jgi:hypothetical protein
MNVFSASGIDFGSVTYDNSFSVSVRLE